MVTMPPMHAAPGESNNENIHPQSTSTRRTPLPAGQITILLVLRFCESASTSVIYPFLEELLASVTGDQKKVGYYAGVMEFTRQAVSLVTVMFWSRLSDYIGRKPILLLGTFALAVSMISFGLSKVFWALVVSRCLFSGFNSNAGVIKGMIGEITDHTNSADAFALLHVPWATGYSIGALLGGWLARPHDHFPSLFFGDTWAKYPYLLPCLVMACFSFLGCVVAGFYLEETVRDTFFFRWQNKRLLTEGDYNEISEPLLPNALHDSPPNVGPPPLKLLFTPPILLACANYCILGALHASSNTLQPLYLAMTTSIGGLGLPPRLIGYILGSYGLINAIFQTFLLGRLTKKFGVKKVYVAAMSALVPMFLLPIVMNVWVRIWGWSWGLKVVLGVQVGCGFVLELGYGCIYIFINASAPDKRSLGAVNGLAQTFVSVGRIVIPVFASTLLSFSMEHNVFGGHGYAAYITLAVLTLGGISVSTNLPILDWGSE